FFALLLFCSFFFSSRRRHTRSKRDWSSDVCSSDLMVGLGAVDKHDPDTANDYWMISTGFLTPSTLSYGTLGTSYGTPGTESPERSEERRVGKEGGAWRTRV